MHKLSCKQHLHILNFFIHTENWEIPVVLSALEYFKHKHRVFDGEILEAFHIRCNAVLVPESERIIRHHQKAGHDVIFKVFTMYG